MTISRETSQILTLEEIIKRYPDEWVLIAYTELDEDLNVIRGEVLAHSPERDRLYDNSLPRKGKAIAIEYCTGEVPDNLVVML
jgi:hypothetical protein